MRVRSFEIINADIRKLHDHLIEVGGFAFRAGGAGFFVLVGEKFSASSATTQAQMIVAQREADTVSIDVVAAAGGAKSEHDFMTRASSLLAGFATRHGLEVADPDNMDVVNVDS